MKSNICTERLMDAAIRADGYPRQLRELDTETMAAAAACHEPPYQSYGKLKAYIDEYGRLPPAQYRKPRHKWQRVMTPGTLCRRCQNLEPNGRGDLTCPMLQLRGAAGMRGSVVKCSEYRRKATKKRKRSGLIWPGDMEME